jgi:serine/threonine protein kinase
MFEDVDLSGKTLGNFKILSRLGRGGMAVVYKAHEASLNRVVALKVIGRHLSDDPAFVKRFQREAEAAAQLNHKGIVQIYSIGKEENLHYFTMEYVKGKTLQEIIKEEGLLPVARAVSIVREVAEALAVAHEAGIVHRDIKPPNIMVDTRGGVKVADFGIAQMTTAATKLTATGFFIGTPEYISPEQCQGRPLDGRSDIYSLGVTLYEMLSGKTPFQADTPAGLVLQIVEGRFKPVGELNPNVPQNVLQVVEKMMHTDAGQRYQTAEDVVAALQAVESTAARGWADGSTPTVAIGGPKKRTRTRLYAATVVVLVAALVAAWLFLRPWGAEQSSDVSTESVLLETETGSGEEEETTTLGDEIAGELPPPAEQAAPADSEEPGESRPPETATPKTLASAKPLLPADPTPVPATAPPSNALIVTTTGGEYEYVDLVNAWVESVFVSRGFQLVDWASAPAESMYEAARFHCVTTARPVATTPLTYLGRVTEQFTVALTMKVVSLADGTTVAGPVTDTVKHTAINAEQVLEPATRKLASKLASQLR